MVILSKFLYKVYIDIAHPEVRTCNTSVLYWYKRNLFVETVLGNTQLLLLFISLPSGNMMKLWRLLF